MKKQLTRIFITTYEDDYLWLKFLLLSLEKYAKGFSGITIVCDDNKSKIPQTTLDIIQTMPLHYLPLQMITNSITLNKILILPTY